jgi:cytochrome b involved in lipid metabolism
VLALFTFGEGYHNYHHEFQHDYRNGVRPWQWDPTKWLIWSLSKLGLTSNLRRVPKEIVHSRISEKSPEPTGAGNFSVIQGFCLAETENLESRADFS